MPADWSAFLGALSARGCSFADVAQASDRKAVIHSLGISDALDVAIIETLWTKNMSSSSSSSGAIGLDAAAATAAAPNHQHQQQRSPPPPAAAAAAAAAAFRASGSTAWHRMDAARLRHEPEEIQECIIAEELSFALRGVSGALIRFDVKTKRPVLAPSLPTSTAQMVTHALANAAALFQLEAVCRHEYSGGSLIRSAVGEAVREVCAAYVRTVADLQEKCGGSAFSLSRLCTEVDGAGYAVRRLASLFAALADPAVVGPNVPQAPDVEGGGLTGPWLLNALHLQYNRAVGNPDDERILGLVLRRAARPYLRILFDWMHRGDLRNDPYKEFFVVDSLPQGGAARGSGSGGGGGGDGGTDDAIDRWENRFQLVSKQVPLFLSTNKVYKQVHTSGKYCHMLRETAAAAAKKVSEDGAAGAAGNNENENASNSLSASIVSAEDEQAAMFEWGDTARLERAVHKAHTAASTNVLRMLVAQHRLVDRLKSLRLYFFVAHGDWLVNFLDAAGKLLQRPASEVKSYSLNLLLQSSISKSCAREDPCHGFTRASLADVTLAQAIELSRKRDPTFTSVYRAAAAATGAAPAASTATNQQLANAGLPAFELLQLEAASEWPLSLILNDIFVTKLNFAFRLLLRCKVCERALQQLSTAGRSGATATGSSSSFSSIPGAASLRMQLLQFVRQFQFYASHEVLEPAWKTFLAKVEMAPGINHIGSASSELCHAILRGLALSSEHGFRILWSILDIALAFAQMMMITAQQQQQQYYSPSSSSSTAAAAIIGADDDAGDDPQQQQAQQLAEWQTELYRLLSELADPSKPDSTNLLQMLVWLDFNGFYERLGVYKVRHAVRHDRSYNDDAGEAAGTGAAAVARPSSGAGPVPPPQPQPQH